MPTKKLPAATSSDNGMSAFFQRVFAIMFGAVALTAATTWLMLAPDMLPPAWMFNIQGNVISGMSILFYVLLFGGLGIAWFAQARAFSLKTRLAGFLLALYAITIGIVITPLVFFATQNNPESIIWAFGLAAAMFGCMALFGYKTTANLGFLGRFLFMGVIGLILIGIASIFWPLGSTMTLIVCVAGIIIFALLTSYNMQFLKNAYTQIGDKRDNLAILGALQLYIAFIAMFQYILALLNRR
ncbi:membrane protein [Bacteroidia bacterium]|nr:membrane protein [Bacteroidia bacterium]